MFLCQQYNENIITFATFDEIMPKKSYQIICRYRC